MSKRELKKYIVNLTKNQLEEQILDLYNRFKNVKDFYDFAFNPKEDKLLEECKFKISKEYFPVNGRKAKMRRSTAHKYIRQFKLLGVESSIIADVMLYNIEIAQTYSSEHYIKQESFYLSIFKSYDEAIGFLRENRLLNEFKTRIDKIVDECYRQNWFNKNGFQQLAEF
ncbi:MAG TPA: hypothetical protein DDX39_08430 [Bacteroidales bacterium]|nr:MAG: hypothetical protein A2W98_11165 [Bacteroidetes bacterium GWF2_33_38]OFY76604.1 MAG: hypothetical protein A2265_01845 [Bacteroidetes bacterium RIFOXYA12_FULL_33_9]OFY89257.1 MAG: hypothetical protein A2236_07960 [Bacteroidetes bacterium RIFOXYA2_FULL_33_7]HBF88653.1 hypothetical protein [Bacteroidales bacterium]